MGMNFLTAAADLVSLGFKIFPLVPGRKVPLVDAWQIVATDDADVISGWAGQWPRANIGFVTGVKSDVLIIDVDMTARCCRLRQSARPRQVVVISTSAQCRASRTSLRFKLAAGWGPGWMSARTAGSEPLRRRGLLNARPMRPESIGG